MAILAGFSCIVFLLSWLMDQFDQHRKKIMILGIVITVIQLSLFKYYDFFKAQITPALEHFNLDSSGLVANLILPLGISYYSFQAISYLVSRYRKETDVPAFNIIDLLLHFCIFLHHYRRPNCPGTRCKRYERYTGSTLWNECTDPNC